MHSESRTPESIEIRATLANGRPTITVGRVLNSSDIDQHILPANSVYIDTGSPFANPFRVGVHGTREEVCDRFDLMLANSPEALESLDYLKGKDLICFYDGNRCHGHTLVMLAAMPYRERLNWADQVIGTPEPMLMAA